jgi:hypothetical protein
MIENDWGDAKMRRSEASAAVCRQQLGEWHIPMRLFVRCRPENPDRRATDRVPSRRRIFRRAEPSSRSASTQLPSRLRAQFA